MTVVTKSRSFSLPSPLTPFRAREGPLILEISGSGEKGLRIRGIVDISEGRLSR